MIELFRRSIWTITAIIAAYTLWAQSVLGQTTIDSKFVGGPQDQNGGYEDPSKFVIAQNGVMYVTCSNGVFASVNGGGTWTALSTSTVADFTFGPDSTLYLAGGSGVYASTNYGSAWTNLSAQLPNGPFSSIAVAPNGTIFTGCPTGVFRSTDHGADWDHIAQTEIPFASSSLYVMVTLRGTILARNGNSYFRSTDNGISWNPSFALTAQIWPVSADTILREGNTGIERSTDDGVSWQEIPGLPQGNPYDVAIDQNGNVFAFFAWQLYSSNNEGATWTDEGTISGGGEQLAFGQDHTLYFFKPSEGMWRTLKPLSNVAEDMEPSFDLNLKGMNTIVITLPESSKAGLFVMNELGNVVFSMEERSFSAGEHSVILPNALSRGLYFCIFRTRSKTKIMKVFVQ